MKKLEQELCSAREGQGGLRLCRVKLGYAHFAPPYEASGLSLELAKPLEDEVGGAPLQSKFPKYPFVQYYPLRESNPCYRHEKAMSLPLDERDKGE